MPADCEDAPVTPEVLERWVEAGWVDLRVENCRRWRDRIQRIYDEVMAMPAHDTSSRYLRNPRFWDQGRSIQPGKIVGWILSVEERGARFKR